MIKKLIPLLAVPLLFGCVVQEDTGDEASVFLTDEAPAQADIASTPDFFAAGRMSNVSYDAQHFSIVSVEVVDADGLPAAGVKVQGRFTGDLEQKFSAVTDAEGIVNVKSSVYNTHRAVGVTLTRASYLGVDGQTVSGNLFADDIQPRFCQHGNPTE